MRVLQPELEDGEELMWEDMLSNCPLEPIAIAIAKGEENENN